MADIPDFNPRLREGGDLVCFRQLLQQFNISIHASAKEATSQTNQINALAKFQSTPPRRRRLDASKEDTLNSYISIHASAKEATAFADQYSWLHVFQSTPPRRRRRHLCQYVFVFFVFQSTPPRRRRPEGYTMASRQC